MHALKCYGCGWEIGPVGWRYTGTDMILCPKCHGFQKRPEAREMVDMTSVRVIYRSAFVENWSAGPFNPHKK
jgi:hypothetical protein